MRATTYEQLLKLIARNVRARRTALGLSQEEVADQAGMAVRQWQRIEAGKGIVLRTLVAAANGLDMEIAELLRRQ